MTTTKGDLQRERQTIIALKERTAQLAQVKQPKRIVHKRIDQVIEDLAARCYARQIALGHFTARQESHLQIVPVFGSPEQLAALLAWLDPERLRKRLREAVEPAYQDGDGLDDAAFELERARLTKELFEAETREERLVVKANAEGARDVTRRCDANPAAIVAAGA